MRFSEYFCPASLMTCSHVPKTAETSHEKFLSPLEPIPAVNPIRLPGAGSFSSTNGITSRKTPKRGGKPVPTVRLKPSSIMDGIEVPMMLSARPVASRLRLGLDVSLRTAGIASPAGKTFCCCPPIFTPLPLMGFPHAESTEFPWVATSLPSF